MIQTAPQILIDGATLRVDFLRFDLDAYALFLKVKRLPEYTIELIEGGDGGGEMAYRITAPARFAPLLGVAAPLDRQGRLDLPDFLHDDQVAIVGMALDEKRFACWSDCGLGKTLIGLEMARQVCHITRGRALIVTFGEIMPQWVSEAEKFYAGETGCLLPILPLHTRAAMKEWCATGSLDGKPTGFDVAVVNYEKFNHESDADQVVSELRHLALLICDESSRLKTGGGQQKWAVIKSARGIEYKLSLTATPAPNEVMEFASQAAFLEKMRDANEIIWTYFRRDEKTHRWTVKPHARKAFFEFMAGWSIYVRDPRKYGWRMNVQPPPEPQTFIHTIGITAAQRRMVMDYNADPANVPDSAVGGMFAENLSAIAAGKLSQAAKGFVYRKANPDGSGRDALPVDSLKPRFVADLIAGEAADGTGLGLRTMVWTVFDEETRILADLLKDAPFKVEVLSGLTPKKERPNIIERFRSGETRVLLGRANMLGFGMNFQFVRSMVVSGFTFSYEQFYQLVRRAYRDGQKYRLRLHVPMIPELEGQMWDALTRKAGQHEAAIAEMEANYVAARRELIAVKERVA